jgi:hypothetical protein
MQFDHFRSIVGRKTRIRCTHIAKEWRRKAKVGIFFLASDLTVRCGGGGTLVEDLVEALDPMGWEYKCRLDARVIRN